VFKDLNFDDDVQFTNIRKVELELEERVNLLGVSTTYCTILYCIVPLYLVMAGILYYTILYFCICHVLFCCQLCLYP